MFSLGGAGGPSDPQPATLPPTSLAICSRNRPRLLRETVESILRGDEVPTEIVIVDQSDDPHPTLAARRTTTPCEIRYLWSRTRGSGQGRNAALVAAKHDLLVLTDDDMRATPDWFGALVRALLAAGPRSVVTGQVPPADEPGRPGGFAPSTATEQDRIVYEGRIGADILYTGNMAMHRSAIAEIGPFDARLGAGAPFPAAEDNDFGFRLLEAGYRIVYVPEAVLYHRAWRSQHARLRMSWRYGVGQGAFYAKHWRPRDQHMLRRLARDITLHLLESAQEARRQSWRAAICEAAYVAGLLSGACRWRLTQRGP